MYSNKFLICAGHLIARSDVYSFGVVLLELLTGRVYWQVMAEQRAELG
jgi:serine/threonine protein kinase